MGLRPTLLRDVSDSLRPHVVCQAPLSMGFPRQEYWSGLPFPPPGDLPNPGIEPESPAALALQAASLPTETKPSGRWLNRGRGVGQSTCLHWPDQAVTTGGAEQLWFWIAPCILAGQRAGDVRGRVPQDRASESRRCPRGLPLHAQLTPPPSICYLLFFSSFIEI